MTPFKIRMHLASLLRRIFSRRFLKFGTVGVSGIVVNQGVLYAMQEHVFHVSAAAGQVDWLLLNISLAAAIFLATLNNFFWNRLWTWKDRVELHHRPWLVQFGQYTLSCGLSIALQFVFTNLLAPHVYYLIANFIAIGVTSVLNFLLNDIWTFGRLKLLHKHEPPKEG
ncbi:MAG: GtrA family protein [Gammaproteobacteria bacterium]|nr:GtrA family protein [Gammaproteobacteria bacterium]MBU1776274.1 GtrA family protein [Gammaproteobacteria bacterium]MBU1967997.1 GtrA family protein [Gammaproteobacteria bacterium]